MNLEYIELINENPEYSSDYKLEETLTPLRHVDGRPIYTKTLVTAGLPETSIKLVDTGLRVTEISSIWLVNGSSILYGKTSNNDEITYHSTDKLTTKNTSAGSSFDHNITITVVGDKYNVKIETSGNISSSLYQKGLFTLYFTKSTDNSNSNKDDDGNVLPTPEVKLVKSVQDIGKTESKKTKYRWINNLPIFTVDFLVYNTGLGGQYFLPYAIEGLETFIGISYSGYSKNIESINKTVVSYEEKTSGFNIVMDSGTFVLTFSIYYTLASSKPGDEVSFEKLWTLNNQYPVEEKTDTRMFGRTIYKRELSLDDFPFSNFKEFNSTMIPWIKDIYKDEEVNDIKSTFLAIDKSTIKFKFNSSNAKSVVTVINTELKQDKEKSLLKIEYVK